MTTKKKSSTMQFLDELIGEPLTLSNLLSTIRETDEVTQAALADRLGISKQHLCDIEKGRKVVSPERAARFAEELGYSKEQFVRLALQQMLTSAGLEYQVNLSSTRKTPRATSTRRVAHRGVA